MGLEKYGWGRERKLFDTNVSAPITYTCFSIKMPIQIVRSDFDTRAMSFCTRAMGFYTWPGVSGVSHEPASNEQ
jgi:hypothetical protein